MCIPDTCNCIFVLLHAPLRVVAYNVAKVQNICCIAFDLKILWYGSMAWNMEGNFSMEWKIFGIERKKIPSMEYGKSSSIPCPAYKCNNQNKNFQKRVTSLESLFI